MKEVFEWLAANKQLLMGKYIYNAIPVKADSEDFFQDLFLYLGTKDEKKLKDILDNGDIEKYMCVIIRNAFNSTTSKYFYNYTKHVSLTYREEQDERYCTIDTTTEDNEALTDINESCKQLLEDMNEVLYTRGRECPIAYYDMKVFQMYYEEEYTYRELGEKLGIPMQSIHVSVNRTKNKLISKFNKEIVDIKQKFIYYNEEFNYDDNNKGNRLGFSNHSL